MKKYHKCHLCGNLIVGGDVVIDERNEKKYSHQFCVTKFRIENTPKPKGFFFGSLRRRI